ncbi:FAD/NAD(P)-binding protein [Glutamicibacter creatinolyticus]|uniref:FAD/NAD(P)-binding protein n=1 Tax=Glutamicibacter creatinolyticus TaxID=162496 RepID=UPI0031D5D277
MSTQRDDTKATFAVAIIGAGPRGTSTVERLASMVANTGRLAVQLRVIVLDAYRPGSGHVWDSSQSPNFWMNTPASFPTVAPDRQDSEPGLSFAQFVQRHGDGANLSQEQQAELQNTSSGTYPTRALYGRYLEHVYDRCAAVLTGHPDVDYEFIRGEVVTVDPREATYRVSYETPGSDQRHELRADAVVLALGHQAAELNPQQKVLAEQAQQAGAIYIGPSIPLDVDYSKFSAGKPALLRGMGLNFFDAMAELTIGRGGQFREVSQVPGERFDYLPSGKEPVLVAASRRGTPYWGKPLTDRFIPEDITLHYLQAEELMQQVAEARGNNPEATLVFSRDIWPLLHRDILWAYYSQCAREHETQLPIPAEQFLSHVAEILDAEHHEGTQVWLAALRDFITGFPMIQWLDVPGLAHPFEEIGFPSHEHYQQAVRQYLRHNAHCSARGMQDPLSWAVLTMNAGRMVVKDLIAQGLIDQQSKIEEIQGRFEPLVEGMASGPPLERIEQLLALSRAGLVSFAGPEPRFEFDALAGEFTVSSPWVDSEGYTARLLCESMMPANRVLQNNTRLMRQLLGDRVARAFHWQNADGELIPGSGFDVVGEPYRLVAGDGTVHRGIFVLGLQLSSVQWGTAIAAQSGDVEDPAARTLGDAHLVVNELARLSGLGISHLSLRRSQQGAEVGVGAGPDYD